MGGQRGREQTPRLGTGAGVQPQAVPGGFRRSIQELGLPGAPGRERSSTGGGPCGGTCWVPRSESPPPSRASPWRNSFTSTRPSLFLSSSSKRRPQRCRRSASPGPPRMAPGEGGEARQWQPQPGLRGTPSPPGPHWASSAATATAASALPAWLWHLLEAVTARRRRTRQTLCRLPRPYGGGLGAELGVWGCLGMAQPRENRGSFWEKELDRSMVSILFSVFRLCVPQLTLSPRWQSREMSAIGSISTDLPPLLILFRN